MDVETVGVIRFDRAGWLACLSRLRQRVACVGKSTSSSKRFLFYELEKERNFDLVFDNFYIDARSALIKKKSK
jgi:hypothetical protein